MLDVYSDADYAGDLDSARSTSGFAMFIGSSLVSWASRRQPVVAKSTTEEQVEDKAFTLDYVPTDKMPADVLTKPLDHVVHERMCHLLGLRWHVQQ